MRFRSFLPSLLALGLPLIGGCGRAQSADTGWWGHVEALASDEMRGRRTGTEEYRRAADYVAAAFRRIGVAPGHAAGYFQEVPFIARAIDEARSGVTVLRPGAAPETLRIGADVTLQRTIAMDREVDAEAVFVGYAVVAPEAGYDDLEGLDLRDKIAVYVNAGPNAVPNPLRAHVQYAAERWARLRAAGAIGVIQIPNPTPAFSWARYTSNRVAPGLALDDPKGDEFPGQRFGARLNPTSALAFFRGAPHGWEEIAALVRKGSALPRFPLPFRVRAHVEERTWRLHAPNVMGLIRGRDPKLADEYVLMTAHLDHLGVGAPVAGDSVYNGAMDNAAGVATLIEVARALASGTGPRRSVLLAAVAAEEEGLLGSAYFALHPPVPMERIVAELNVDMVLPIVPLRHIVVFGLEESTLGGRVTEVARRHGVETQDDPEPERNLFIRSDQYNLIRAGVPSLSFVTGYLTGSPTHETLRRFRRERYHAPSDDLDQPVDHAAAALWNEILLDLLRDTADRVERPRWNAGSYFARFARGAEP